MIKIFECELENLKILKLKEVNNKKIGVYTSALKEVLDDLIKKFPKSNFLVRYYKYAKNPLEIRVRNYGNKIKSYIHQNQPRIEIKNELLIKNDKTIWKVKDSFFVDKNTPVIVSEFVTNYKTPKQHILTGDKTNPWVKNPDYQKALKDNPPVVYYVYNNSIKKWVRIN